MSNNLHNQCVYSLVLTATAAVGGNSGKHWKYERVVSIALLGLIPTGLIYPNVVVDYGLAVALPLHGHWSVLTRKSVILVCW